ncbi:peptidase M50 [Mycolicibacterium sp. P9-22]|uniref:peptidase M50 n=1 Tax=Mycolicibacterium sp. P9-22 TaxID=2024613 RepID=UPI0011EFA3C2|nr:peptidase M50 [Mycolicibacterium sp. P9-22]
MTTTNGRPDCAVLLFDGRRPPRALGHLPAVTVQKADEIEAAATARRIVVVGTDKDLAAVLTKLLKAEKLGVEVAFVPRRRTAATRAYGLPTGRRAARAALTHAATRVPLIRDDSGRALVGAGLWVGETGLEGEAVVDDTVLFDGEATAVRIEPIGTMPGLRAAVLSSRMRPKRWVTGRAAQLGTTGASVIRDGDPSTRAVRRSTFYRHTEGWLAVR